jgi:hypothetical protein
MIHLSTRLAWHDTGAPLADLSDWLPRARFHHRLCG